MIVVCLSDCPSKLRGDITKWLMEVNTGVYVCNLSVRVRDELWERICKNIGNGRATMAFSTSGEQRMGLYIHNTPWKTVDCEGITLIRRPLPGQITGGMPHNFSNAAHRQMRNHKKRSQPDDGYCAIDLETTGLTPGKDCILEIGAVRVRDGKIQEEFHVLISETAKIPNNIVLLTGIVQEELEHAGVPLLEAMDRFLAFIGQDRLIAHNAAFENRFLRYALAVCHMPMMQNSFVDTMLLSKRRLPKLKNYQLRTIAEHYGLKSSEKHRALDDSRLAAEIYEKLNA